MARNWPGKFGETKGRGLSQKPCNESWPKPANLILIWAGLKKQQSTTGQQRLKSSGKPTETTMSNTNTNLHVAFDKRNDSMPKGVWFRIKPIDEKNPKG